jgi:hypothetical protein
MANTTSFLLKGVIGWRESHLRVFSQIDPIVFESGKLAVKWTGQAPDSH